MALTANEVIALQPKLRLVATAQRFNGVETDDLVQATSLVLLTTKRKFTNPIVFAVSTMKDYCRKHGSEHYKHTKNGSKTAIKNRRISKQLLAKSSKTAIDKEIWWSNLKLDSVGEQVVRLHLDGMTQRAIAKKLKRSTSWVSKTWIIALNTIKNRWTKQHNIETHMTTGTLRSATKHAQVSTEVVVEIAGKLYAINNWRLEGNPKGHPEAEPPTPPTKQLLVLEVKK